MNTKKLSLAILITAVALLLNACGASKTPAPPKTTPIPPTPVAIKIDDIQFDLMGVSKAETVEVYKADPGYHILKFCLLTKMGTYGLVDEITNNVLLSIRDVAGNKYPAETKSMGLATGTGGESYLACWYVPLPVEEKDFSLILPDGTSIDLEPLIRE